mmetsp:Transcript_29745/g.49083  ORF Transcript_29745/g.49083 Transcript_29745/m.49083 type:complete len:246 (-) Transcript_29745:69-806(-)|eukprot:CAMPEP_0119013166 /NCGR_PEP_ID=MMETSP1176-20130426/8062_1 /TAXON_ID=265551 /ORGANISM="Synedropsis recta cf, Strain CCMP1620" /LENGTH=245 /DNA_ID=CAMNT_0006966225 /DNA_START=60 /DNA_END=797 /DNA_ORIENTATION=+
MMMRLSIVVSLLSVYGSTGFAPVSVSQQQRVHSELSMSSSSSSDDDPNANSRRNVLVSSAAAMMAAAVSTIAPDSAMARLEAVNRPDLLPAEKGMNVIQTEKFLTTGQARRMNDMLTALERDTGFRVRVLCQNYPNTPGLAIRDYWDLGKEDQKDDKYIVLVLDQFGGRGNVLNFNVGEGVKFALPNVFWTRLSGKYGTTFYVKENGVDLAAINAIEAIASCLRSEEEFCINIPDQGQSMKSLGF